MQEEYEEVTDPELLANLNHQDSLSKQIQSIYQHEKDNYGMKPEGTLKTLGHSMFNAPFEAIGNVMSKFGSTTPQIMQEAIYGKGKKGLNSREAHEKGQEAHPIADLIGSLLGFGPVGAGTSAGLRSIPAIGRAVKSASPSLLKRTALHGLEGGAIGSLYSPEGNEGEGFGLGSLIGGALGGPGVGIARNLSKYRQQGSNVANIEELGANRDIAHQAHVDQQAVIDALKKNYAEQGTGLGNIEGITRNINQRLGKIGELEESANIPHEQTENLLNWPGGEELVQEASNQKNMGLKEMDHYLRSGIEKDMPLDVAAANEVKHSIRAAKSHIQKNYYDPVTEYTKNNHIQLPRTVDIKHIEEQLQKINSNPNFKNSPSFEKLKQEMIKMKSGHDLVPANDFVNQWKETKQAASKARRKGFQEGGENQAYWQDEAANLKELADKQLKILEQHLPKQYFDKLMQADKLWKEEIAPFYGNKIYEQVKKLGRIDVPDIAKELRGSGMGQEKMLELFLSNPKLTRLALAHSHAKNPVGLLSPKPHEHAFINRLPSLQGMLERSRGHSRALDIAKAQHESLKSSRARTEIGHQEIVKRQVERQKSLGKQEKLKREVEELHRKREHLAEQERRGKITKEEFDRLDHINNEAIKNKQSALRKLGKVIKYGAVAVGVSGAIKKLLS